MRILITTVFFPPQNAIASQRPYVWAREWARAGHDVTVLTIGKDTGKGDLSPQSFDGFRVIATSPGFVISKLRARKKKPTAASGEVGRGNLNRLKRWLKYRGLLSSVRLPDIFDFWVPEARKVLREDLAELKFDYIVSTFGPPASLRVGHAAKKQNAKAKWIVDFRDLWSENHVYRGFWPLTYFEKFLERFYLSKADGVVTVSEALARTLREKAPTKPVHVFENGFDPDEMRERIPYQDGGNIRLVYTGSLHPIQRNPEPLFQALAKLSTEHRRKFEVIFAGANADFLFSLVNKYSLAEVVQFAGSLDRKASLKLQANASVLLFFEFQHPTAVDGVLTGKLFEYLATGRPIWAIGIDSFTTVGQLIEKNQVGNAFGQDVDALRTSLEKLAQTAPAKSRDVDNENDLIHKFDRKKTALKMLSWMEKEPVQKS